MTACDHCMDDTMTVHEWNLDLCDECRKDHRAFSPNFNEGDFRAAVIKAVRTKSRVQCDPETGSIYVRPKTGYYTRGVTVFKADSGYPDNAAAMRAAYDGLYERGWRAE